ncbi:hypothetical protein DX933_02180 [Ornithinibacillus gellani]|uniref:sporulation membrane protein YtrI n=1 Tax=Ornithinibacillus gellani TaxID=2293253 RepID=UPI000F48D6B9|nr:sporulation membrane protein YtrI [Ornithinibacillus gellani]TQS76254.1 hypothetical protein DX933_02180 [Ornithinibacillus gellani]
MHIPPYYKKPTWQYIIIGIFFGSLIAYGVLIFMYGKMYEDLLANNMRLRTELSDAKKQNTALLKANEDLDELSKKTETIKRITLSISNAESLRLDTFIIYQLEEMIKEEIDHLIGQDVQTVAESDELIIAAIENKTYRIDDFSYTLTINRLAITKEIKLKAIAKISN